MNCGHEINPQDKASTAPLAHSASHLLGIWTLRLILMLFAIVIIKAILLRLPFVEGIRIPDFPITMEGIITSITYIIVLLLLLAYAQSLRVLWAQAYPKYSEAGGILAVLIYVAVLVAAYYALLPILIAIEVGRDIIFWFEVLLLVIALILLAWVGISLYRFLPKWLSNIHLPTYSSQIMGVACLNCGRLNNIEAHHCSNCGESLGKKD